MRIDEMVRRMDEFCTDYRIRERQRGTLRLVADMCWALGLDPTHIFVMSERPREMLPEDIGLETKGSSDETSE